MAISLANGATNLNRSQRLEMLKAHNYWRSKVRVARMRWSNKLATSAQRWANHLSRNNGCNMVHSHGSVGENLYWASPIQWSNGRTEVQKVQAKKVANSWASENRFYNYSRNRCARGRVCGHYTQMVWKTSTKLGCGMAICSDRSQVWVCHYQPAGNYIGRRPY